MMPTQPALPGICHSYPLSIYTLYPHHFFKEFLEWGIPGKSGLAGCPPEHVYGGSFFGSVRSTENLGASR